jgi:hypothetical protein
MKETLGGCFPFFDLGVRGKDIDRRAVGLDPQLIWERIDDFRWAIHATV